MKSEIILHDHSVTFETNEPVVEKDGLVVNIVGGIGPRGTKGDKGDTPEKGVDYFTEEDIDEIADAAAGKVYVPSNVSELENDAGYLTEHQDVSGKADRDEIPTRVSELENDMGYLTEHQDVSGKADKSELPTRVSELENDAGYLTEHQDISQKADKSEIPVNVSELVNDAGYLTQHQDISNKAEKSEIPTKVSELENDTGYITGYTETDPTVPAWAKNAVKPTYTASEVGALPDNTHIPSTTGELENDAGFITADDLPVNVSELVNDAGYLTQHQDISGKADKSEIPVNVSELTNDAGYLTTETDPTVPAWAKAAQKPEYTAAEVGATTEQQVGEMIADAMPDVPVQDVQVDGSSVLYNGVASIEAATSSKAGVVIVNPTYGMYMTNRHIVIQPQNDSTIKNGNWSYGAITPSTQHKSAFYGLAKAAGDTTQSQSDNAVGIYTDEAKTAIRSMLDVPATSDIPEVPVQDVQVNGSSIIQNGVANIPIGNGLRLANNDTKAIMVSDPSVGDVRTGASNRVLRPADQGLATFYGLASVAGDTTQARVIGNIGQYTPEAKTAIQTMLDVPSKSDIPDVPVQDVQVNGASVLSNGVANVPAANDATFGVIKTSQTYGTGMHDGQLQIQAAPASHYKSGEGSWRPVVPSHQHESTFYGLAKAAGDTSQSASSNTVGTYTDEAKTAIQNMLDVPSNTDLAQAISGVEEKIQHMYICSAAEYNSETGVPTVANPDSKMFYLVPSAEGSPNLYIEWVYLNDAWERFGSATIDLSNYVQFSDYATANKAGVVKVNPDYGVAISNGYLFSAYADGNAVKTGTHSYRVITPATEHAAVFYGLAKAAGDTTQKALPYAVGSYTPEAQSAIRSMLGAANADDIVAVQDTQPTSEDNKIWLPETPPEGVEVPTVAEMNEALAGKVDDVQVNGTSIVQDGVANIPVGSNSSLGVVKGNSIYGVTIWGGSTAGQLATVPATDAQIKANNQQYAPITPTTQYASTFYGLAKAAGDTTQSQSDKPVGQYTDAAKTAIKTMLGIEEGGSSGEVVTPIDDTAGVGDTAKVWSADKTSTEINNIIDTAPTEELAAELLMQEETNTYLNEKFLSSIHNMFESLPQDEILSEILEGLVDGNSLLRQLYHELEARKLAAE